MPAVTPTVPTGFAFSPRNDVVILMPTGRLQYRFARMMYRGDTSAVCGRIAAVHHPGEPVLEPARGHQDDDVVSRRECKPRGHGGRHRGHPAAFRPAQVAEVGLQIAVVDEVPRPDLVACTVQME